MKRHPRRDVFTYTVLLKSLIIGCAVLCGAGLAYEYVGPRTPLGLVGFGGLTLLSCLALVQVFRGRIELRADEIRVVEFIGHNSYPRAELVEARWAVGCRVSVRRRDGTWIKLPDTGNANPKVAGAIRAWLNEATSRAGAAAQQGDEADEAFGGTRPPGQDRRG